MKNRRGALEIEHLAKIILYTILLLLVGLLVGSVIWRVARLATG